MPRKSVTFNVIEAVTSLSVAACSFGATIKVCMLSESAIAEESATMLSGAACSFGITIIGCMSNESAIAQVWAAEVLADSNLSTIAGVLGAGDLTSTSGILETESLSAITGFLEAGNLVATSDVADTEVMTANTGFVMNMGLSETLWFV